MVRVSRNLLLANMLMAATALAGCGSSSDDDGADSTHTNRPGLIQFTPMFSAFDGGEHTYQVTPFIPSANPMSKDSDPVMESTIVWKVDDAYLKKDAFSEIPGAVLLTTKKSGTTVVSVTATTASGIKIKGQSMLTISQADPQAWLAGDMRYNNGNTIMLFGMGAPGMAPGGMGSCGLPIDLSGRIPTNSACSNCHNNMGGIVIEHTPTQTAGYSDQDLIEIFTNAQKPAGGMFNSPVLMNTPMPDCIYKTFHTWEIDDEVKKGIVYKLRSITPKKQEDIDFARIAQMAAAAQSMGMSAAAGAPAP